MIVLNPIKVTDAILHSVNVAEDDFAQWDDVTTYGVGDLCISTATHTVYQSLADGNVGVDPDLEVAARSDPFIVSPAQASWQIIGATNRWRLFDQRPSRPATRTGDIEIELRPAMVVGGIAGFGIDADSVRIQVLAGDEQLYDRTIVLRDDTGVTDALSYYTAPFVRLSEFVVTDLPILGAPRVLITVSGNTEVSVGQIVIGQRVDLGVTLQEGSGFSGLDFSAVRVDDFGDLETVRRPATRLFDLSVSVERGNLASVVHTLNTLRGGVAAVWIGSMNNRLALIGYGFYRNYRTVYVGARHSQLTLEIQGVT